jgi:hypothetical protein
MHKADGEACFAYVDIPNLLINPPFGDRLPQILR